MASERDPIPCPVCREVIIGPLSAAVHLSDTHGLSMYGALARLARELEEARGQHAAMCREVERLTGYLFDRQKAVRELEEARERERGYREALERIIGLTFDSPIAPPGGPDPHADDLYNRVVRVNRAARRALAATPPQEASER